MHQVSPGEARLYGGYSVPLEPLSPHTTLCGGCNARIRHRTPAARNIGWSNAYPSAPVPPRRPRRPMTVHGANRLGLSEQRTLFRSQQKIPKIAHNNVQRPCERQQQLCNRSDTSDAIDLSERSAQRDSTCVNIIFDPPNPALAVRRPQRYRLDTSTSGSSKSLCSQSPCDPARLQGGGCRRHDCVGTQFATLLQDVLSQLRLRRLAADIVKTPLWRDCSPRVDPSFADHVRTHANFRAMKTLSYEHFEHSEVVPSFQTDCARVPVEISILWSPANCAC